MLNAYILSVVFCFCFAFSASLCEVPEEKISNLEKALEYFKSSLAMRRSLAYTPRETGDTLLEVKGVLVELGREEETRVYDAEILGHLESIDLSHVKY